MRSPGMNGEGELRGQPANPGSPGKMAFKTECVCVCVCVCFDRCQCSARPKDPEDLGFNVDGVYSIYIET